MTLTLGVLRCVWNIYAIDISSLECEASVPTLASTIST
jgi:hypothetical protein